MGRRVIVGALVTVNVLAAGTVRAESDMIGIGKDRFTLAAGSFLPAFDTNVRIEGEDLGQGDDVDVEDDLGIERDDQSIYLAAGWRFKPKHRLFASYFESSRSSEVVAKEEIQIGDEVYPAGATLRSDFSLSVLPINYAYSWKQTDRYELAFTGGLHWNAIELNVDGIANLGDAEGERSVEAKVDAPMPLVGVDFEYALTPRWLAGARAEVFWFDFSGDVIDVGGTILNVRLNTEYWLTRSIGIGAAVNYFDFSVDVDSDSWVGELDYGYVGPQVYAALRF